MPQFELASSILPYLRLDLKSQPHQQSFSLVSTCSSQQQETDHARERSPGQLVGRGQRLTLIVAVDALCSAR